MHCCLFINNILGIFAVFLSDNKAMGFWIRVKNEIRQARTTQEWVATKVGVRPDTFSRWIQRNTMPNADQVVAIAHVLGVTVEYLVTGKDATLPAPHLRGLFHSIEALSESDIAEISAIVNLKLSRH